MEVNAHIHLPPNFSAFDSVDQAVRLAGNRGIRALGVSNYYDYSIYRAFGEIARRWEILPLYGIEIITLLPDLQRQGIKINDPGNPGKMYICGKGISRFDPLSEEAERLLRVIRSNDSTRMGRMTGKMERLFSAAGLSTGLTEPAIKEQIAHRYSCPLETVYLQERHLAQAFQESLFARFPRSERASALKRLFGVESGNPEDPVGVQNEIRTHLMKAGKPAYVEETFVGFGHAYQLILALGGIPCYPVLADGTYPICPFEEPVERLIDRIRERGIYAAEFITIRNRPETLLEYALKLRSAGIVLTAGTEHNTLDLLPIEPTCSGGEPIPAEVKTLFWEGACVVAAHQRLVAEGQPGYVNEQGNLPCGSESHEDRIARFARMGEEIIQAPSGGIHSADSALLDRTSQAPA